MAKAAENKESGVDIGKILDVEQKIPEIKKQVTEMFASDGYNGDKIFRQMTSKNEIINKLKTSNSTINKISLKNRQFSMNAIRKDMKIRLKTVAFSERKGRRKTTTACTGTYLRKDRRLPKESGYQGWNNSEYLEKLYDEHRIDEVDYVICFYSEAKRKDDFAINFFEEHPVEVFDIMVYQDETEESVDNEATVLLLYACVDYIRRECQDKRVMPVFDNGSDYNECFNESFKSYLVRTPKIEDWKYRNNLVIDFANKLANTKKHYCFTADAYKPSKGGYQQENYFVPNLNKNIMRDINISFELYKQKIGDDDLFYAILGDKATYNDVNHISTQVLFPTMTGILLASQPTILKRIYGKNKTFNLPKGMIQMIEEYAAFDPPDVVKEKMKKTKRKKKTAKAASIKSRKIA